MPPKNRGRKFFEQLQPTFTIDIPKHNTTTLQFLGHSDPSKDTVVRKKAREWVNKNKEILKKTQETQPQEKGKMLIWDNDEGWKRGTQKQVGKTEESITLGDPLRTIGTNAMDPFNLLPSPEVVGRRYGHIIQFFLTTSIEEVPCSDDKYADAKYSLIPFSRDNTVLGNMAENDATFILWLYATVTIRDGMMGRRDTEEVQWFYSRALRVLQATIQKEAEAGKYSVYLLNCLACITATASFAGMFKTAELHRDALVRVLGLRGGGDVLRGLQSAVPWTIKAIQWCEIMVATQLVETPKVPYLIPASSIPPPKIVGSEAARATSISLKSLPALSEALQKIVHLSHLLGIAYAKLRKEEKIDPYITQPLYDVEYALLQVLEAQKEPNHRFSKVEVLLAETLQLYLWTGPRMLPPQTRLCNLLTSRLMRALLPLLLENAPEVQADSRSNTAVVVLDSVTNGTFRSYNGPMSTHNAITWSLALGTIVSASLCRPEHSWFKEHLRLQLQLLGLDKSEEEYRNLLRIFPTTDAFSWIDLKTLHSEYRA